ncbi:MAG: L-histidine N(alpha)-methyltransferase [Pseudomonadota bacterium]
MSKFVRPPEAAGEYQFFDETPPAADIVAEVMAGLTRGTKSISPKYFYDATGAELFEAITRLPEYYLTRTELGLFDQHLSEIAENLSADLCVIEYGSGSSLKIRRVLETLMPKAYVPVDISSEHLQSNAIALHADFPGLDVYPVCADITREFSLPPQVKQLTPVAFYPGSSIGNFEPETAVAFLRSVHRTIGPGGYLLLGVDRKKDPAVLESAYDDASGVTAAFNLNILKHLNETLQADFNLDLFKHVARYNAQAGCIQMFLQSRVTQTITLPDRKLKLMDGELIHTENSYKYHPEEFTALAAQADFLAQAHYTDANDWFSFFVLSAQ